MYCYNKLECSCAWIFEILRGSTGVKVVVIRFFRVVFLPGYSIGSNYTKFGSYITYMVEI